MSKITGTPNFGIDEIILWLGKITNGKTSYMGLILLAGGLGVFAGISLDLLPNTWTELATSLCGAGVTILITGAKHRLIKDEESKKNYE